jgi:HEAT repeat protein
MARGAATLASILAIALAAAGTGAQPVEPAPRDRGLRAVPGGNVGASRRLPVPSPNLRDRVVIDAETGRPVDLRTAPAARPEPASLSDVPRLLAELDTRDDTARSRALRRLRTLSSADLAAASPALIQALADTEKRSGIAPVLRRLCEKGAAPPGFAESLAPLLAHESALTRADAADLLAALGAGARPALPALREAAADPKLRSRVVLAFGRIGADAVPELALWLDDPNVGINACEGLRDIGPDAAPAVPALTRALASTEPRVRACAARTLGQIGAAARPARGALRAVMGNDTDPSGAALAAAEAWIAIGGEGDPAPVVAFLAARLQTRADAERAARLLQRLGPAAAPAAPALVAALAGPAHSRAYHALVAIGPGAMPHVRVALSDPDWSVANSARQVHERIEQEPLP